MSESRSAFSCVSRSRCAARGAARNVTEAAIAIPIPDFLAFNPKSQRRSRRIALARCAACLRLLAKQSNESNQIGSRMPVLWWMTALEIAALI